MGVCGSSCEGKKDVDTIGVYEFDTVTDTVVKTHVMEEGFGGDPYPSPDGSEYLQMSTVKLQNKHCHVLTNRCFFLISLSSFYRAHRSPRP